MIIFFYRVGYQLLRVYWFVLRPKTYGVQCVIEHEGKYLYVQHTYGKSLWNFPGGGINQGETKEAAVRREIKEEVGITLNEIKFLGEFTHVIDYKQDMVYCFYARVEKDNFTKDNREIAEAKWFPNEQLPEPHAASVEKIIYLFNENERAIH